MGRRRNKLLSLLLLPLILVLAGCPLENDVRDDVAGAQGWIQQQQGVHQADCTANPALPICVAVNKAIDAQHVTRDALNVYCGGPPPSGQTPFSSGGPCVPVKSAQAALQAALTNMNQIVADGKALAGGK